MSQTPKEEADEMKANTAATKIQANFRGYRDTREALEEKSATKIQAGIRGFLVRKRQQAVQAAATRIQAGFRGFKTRKLLKQNGQ
ncbi:hypothetical protein EAG_04482 [Camponotus floridanus]|uniref:Abnormal spindle-like microcephaly-associated protein-like protein n=1 Tax=Camponotus floridanus TaxID=104421 RepID=E1ZXL3_CAMFO|nr:hypothetical protein EAG_04482 [Camponotus floridanus]